MTEPYTFRCLPMFVPESSRWWPFLHQLTPMRQETPNRLFLDLAAAAGCGEHPSLHRKERGNTFQSVLTPEYQSVVNSWLAKASSDLASAKILIEGDEPHYDTGCYLLTWNCKHIANAQIIRQLEKHVKSYGYDLPLICTPESL